MLVVYRMREQRKIKMKIKRENACPRAAILPQTLTPPISDEAVVTVVLSIPQRHLTPLLKTEAKLKLEGGLAPGNGHRRYVTFEVPFLGGTPTPSRELPTSNYPDLPSRFPYFTLQYPPTQQAILPNPPFHPLGRLAHPPTPVKPTHTDSNTSARKPTIENPVRVIRA
ncbi:hypothetical protein KQX54_003048 [Cotesia glomerata]|uniref:Uncharacterized protein n=1 Tax=Cotesia glomerata TaxID=32391 RepID=A0AAV7ILZ6_COTGL|nr:hypothetical protein KQX54_003048 [Cotesia glomerata]